MFENLFSTSPATWSALVGGAVALPFLIHLINLMRHRRVEWAAMEFLLKSYKKNRNWVWLKQLLLLLSRMAVLLLALFMLARVGCQNNRVAQLLAGATTHHYVVMDDSFSMTDRSSEGVAFDRARSMLSLIAARSTDRPNQRFTLIRYSRSTSVAASASDEQLELNADINAEQVDTAFLSRLEEIKTGLVPSNLAVNQEDSLRTVSELIKERPNENAIVYVLSDFRAKDWQSAPVTGKLLEKIEESGAAIELIDCIDIERPNLVITELEPDGNVRVAGVPLMMKLSIKNYSESSAQKIQVNIQQLNFDSMPSSMVDPADVEPRIDDLPTVFFDEIGPGESETRRFPIMYRTSGQHVVRAQLPDDSIDIDNSRWNATRFESSAKILLIDDPDQIHARFLALAIDPGKMTGIESVIRTKDYVRDASVSSLAEYDAIFLLDVDRISETAVKNLETYTSNGGGVAVFLGPRTDIEFYNSQLYRDGSGVLPMKLDKVVDIPEQLNERVSDITPLPHPIFDPMLSVKNSLLDLVLIHRIVQPPLEWKPSDSNSTVAATVRGVKTWPLVVDKSYGNGRSILFTTTAGPVWNNWMRNGTFPPILLLLENELAMGKYSSAGRQIGRPIGIEVDSAEYSPRVSFVSPSQNSETRFGLERIMNTPNQGTTNLSTEFGKRLIDGTSETDVPGYYDVWLRRTDSKIELRRFALNADVTESDLSTANPQAMLVSLGDVNPKFVEWHQFSPEPAQQSASALTQFLLFVLLFFLIGEHLLAYSASYHSRPIRQSRRKHLL